MINLIFSTEGIIILLGGVLIHCIALQLGFSKKGVANLNVSVFVSIMIYVIWRIYD